MKSFILIPRPYRSLLIVTGIIFISMAFRDPFSKADTNYAEAKTVRLLDTVPAADNIKIEIDLNKIMSDVEVALSKIDFDKIKKSL